MPRPLRFPIASRRSLLIVIFIAALGWIVASVSASIGSFTPVFKTVPTFTVAANPLAAPYYIISGDFNNDGRPDVVTSTDGNNGTWISLNLGNGNFSPSMSVLGSATHMATADFNADGKLDLAGMFDTSSSTGVSVYLGNGAGGSLLAQMLPSARVRKPSSQLISTATVRLIWRRSTSPPTISPSHSATGWASSRRSVRSPQEHHRAALPSAISTATTNPIW